ncbi:DUF4333 domain-containing protein [Nocardia asteroides]|uniref:DUF4333 domain-containing protein n=1 Tax=Nocardia asteroides TaxID=1824 RepID=UPI001E43D161|nr:DUF4333 domain-containing protein [Nocardia asteroides]UGT63470.1 DUF4333 domain-containing protein [Nocardia asteroides]
MTITKTDPSVRTTARVRGRTARLAGAATLFTLGCALSACSVSIGGDPKIDEADLEKSVSQTLAEEVGQTPDSIDCPGDLTGKVGTTMRCTLNAGGDTIGLTVTVTSVEGDTVNYDVQVDQQ